MACQDCVRKEGPVPTMSYRRWMLTCLVTLPVIVTMTRVVVPDLIDGNPNDRATTFAVLMTLTVVAIVGTLLARSRSRLVFLLLATQVVVLVVSSVLYWRLILDEPVTPMQWIFGWPAGLIIVLLMLLVTSILVEIVARLFWLKGLLSVWLRSSPSDGRSLRLKVTLLCAAGLLVVVAIAFATITLRNIDTAPISDTVFSGVNAKEAVMTACERIHDSESYDMTVHTIGVGDVPEPAELMEDMQVSGEDYYVISKTPNGESIGEYLRVEGVAYHRQPEAGWEIDEDGGGRGFPACDDLIRFKHLGEATTRAGTVAEHYSARPDWVTVARAMAHADGVAFERDFEYWVDEKGDLLQYKQTTYAQDPGGGEEVEFTVTSWWTFSGLGEPNEMPDLNPPDQLE